MQYRRVFMGVLHESCAEFAAAKSLPMYACYPAFRPRRSPFRERRSSAAILMACVKISGTGGGI